MIGPLTRIILRYGIGALVAAGVLSSGLGDALAVDPDVAKYTELVLGAAAAATVEGYYWLARRFGWAT